MYPGNYPRIFLFNKNSFRIKNSRPADQKKKSEIANPKSE